MLEFDEVSVGTVSINENEINRLFILAIPGKVWAMDFAWKIKYSETHSTVTV